jgi:SAM-dependent methyltransferase
MEPKRLSDPDVVAREYATMDRLAMRRLDRTGWLRGDDVWQIALQAVGEVRPARVLDAGCGTGEFAAMLTASEVICVDLSEVAVGAARAKGLAAQVADVQDLPFGDGSFDVVVANWLLYHVADRRRAIAELARVLTPTGRLVGCYNAPGHLEELWTAVGVSATSDDFDAASGPAELRESFATVEVRPAEGQVLWESREAVQAYLDAYEQLHGPLIAPETAYPFRATRRNAVLVAAR